MTRPPANRDESSHRVDTDSLGRRILINTGALAGSSLWRIGVSFVLQLLIARMAGVQALGVYTVALAYLNVGQVISELGLPALLSRDLAPAPQYRRTYYHLALRVQVIAALLVWLGLAALAFALPYGPETRMALILIGASLPFYAVTSASQTLFRAGERMELVLGVEGVINLLIIGFSIVVLLYSPAVLPLIAILVATQAISALLCIIIVKQAALLATPQESASVRLHELWSRTSAFYAISIAEVFQQRLDILLLSVVAGPTVTGIYSAAYNLVRVAVKLIQSYWQSLYPTLSRLYHLEATRYEGLSSLSFRYGLLALLPTAAITTGVAAELVDLIYTDEYGQSAAVLQWLIWLAPILFVATYAVTQLLIQSQAKRGLIVIGANLAVVVLLLPPLAYAFGAVGAAWASVVAAFAGAAAGLIALHRLEISIAHQRLAWVAAATVIAVILAALPPLHWIWRILIGASGYLLMLWLTSTLTPSDMRRFHQAIRVAAGRSDLPAR